MDGISVAKIALICCSCGNRDQSWILPVWRPPGMKLLASSHALRGATRVSLSAMYTIVAGVVHLRPVRLEPKSPSLSAAEVMIFWSFF